MTAECDSSKEVDTSVADDRAGAGSVEASVPPLAVPNSGEDIQQIRGRSFGISEIPQHKNLKL